MHTDNIFNNSKRNIAVLMLTTSAIGLYLLGSACIISRDGVTFIEYAQDMIHSHETVILNQDQHPGFPALILAAKAISSLFWNTISIQTWIYSAQFVSLVSRILAVGVFYFLARFLLKNRTSAFFAALVMIFFPEPAFVGSDALSEWPHLLWLFAAYGLILLASSTGKSHLFALAGFCSGIGYLIRPEAAQVVVIGLIWLTVQLIRSGRLNRIRIVSATVLLLAGFLIPAGPYICLKKAVFPKKQAIQFSQVNPDQSSDRLARASFAPEKYLEAFVKLIVNVGKTYRYFFFPTALIGLVLWLREARTDNPCRFIISSALFLNLAILIWLYCEHHYMALRHTLPAALIMGIFIPIGVRWIAVHLSRNSPSEISKWFAIIILTGLIICSVRLFRPDREKALYLDAAEWIRENSPASASISCRDSRIAFYAGRTRSESGDFIVEKKKLEDPVHCIPAAVFRSEKFGYKVLIIKAVPSSS